MDICFRDPGARSSLEKGIRDGSKVDRKATILSEGEGPGTPTLGGWERRSQLHAPNGIREGAAGRVAPRSQAGSALGMTKPEKG